jgi:hypothetical protein
VNYDFGGSGVHYCFIPKFVVHIFQHPLPRSLAGNCGFWRKRLNIPQTGKPSCRATRAKQLTVCPLFCIQILQVPVNPRKSLREMAGYCQVILCSEG